MGRVDCRTNKGLRTMNVDRVCWSADIEEIFLAKGSEWNWFPCPLEVAVAIALRLIDAGWSCVTRGCLWDFRCPNRDGLAVSEAEAAAGMQNPMKFPLAST